MCLFGKNLGGQKPQNPLLWGVYRRFQAKLAKSKNVHIIKTTGSISTKFCTMRKTTKCPSWVVPTHALQIQDGGRPPSWKNRKIVIISQPRFERFWRNLARRCSSTLLTVPTVKIWNVKNSRWRRPLTSTNIDIQAMLVWLTLPFYDFCGFRSVAVNSVYKL